VILTLAEAVSGEAHARMLEIIGDAEFVDGLQTAGAVLSETKQNEQIASADPRLQAVTDVLLESLRTNSAFREATYPKQLHSVLVSRYRPGMAYGLHVDNALMGGDVLSRTDLSLTLFLNEPDEYEGGELCLESGSGEIRFKLPARHMICYPTSELHQVREVTKGERLAVVGWIQSHVRDGRAREVLWDLSRARDDIHQREGKSRAFDLVNKSHTNLLRRWAEP
jgi:PKHD-type hydroxylase